MTKMSKFHDFYGNCLHLSSAFLAAARNFPLLQLHFMLSVFNALADAPSTVLQRLQLLQFAVALPE